MADDDLRAVLEELRQTFEGDEVHGYSWRQGKRLWETLATALERLEAERYTSDKLRGVLVMANKNTERARQSLEAAERQFPMQDGPRIPWSLAERIYFVYADLFGTEQSLERLAERGGLSWAEIPVIRQTYYRKHGWLPDWSAALAGATNDRARAAEQGQ